MNWKIPDQDTYRMGGQLVYLPPGLADHFKDFLDKDHEGRPMRFWGGCPLSSANAAGIAKALEAERAKERGDG